MALAVALVALLAVAWRSQPAAEDDLVDGPPVAASLTLALIADVPYTPFQLTNFPKLVRQIDSDPDVGLAVHLGDIKNSLSPCSDTYYRRIRSLFEGFDDALVYTPGDNEWTDCHKPQNGGTNPLNRLDGLRNFFFAAPNAELAQRSQRFADYSANGYPENVRFSAAGTSFAAMHVVGANNGLQVWTGRQRPTRQQAAEVTDRTDAAVQLLRDTFADATANGEQSVVVFTQADMFPPNPKLRTRAALSGYDRIVSALAEEATAFSGQVYLFNGDSHVFRTDQPLAANSPWLNFYRVSQPVEKLRRITLDGDVQATNFLRVRVDPRAPEPVTWTRVPLSW